jgi:hypothetical protein
MCFKIVGVMIFDCKGVQSSRSFECLLAFSPKCLSAEIEPCDTFFLRFPYIPGNYERGRPDGRAHKTSHSEVGKVLTSGRSAIGRWGFLQWIRNYRHMHDFETRVLREKLLWMKHFQGLEIPGDPNDNSGGC